jgi:XTP/dITP diphosphohydrolase
MMVKEILLATNNEHKRQEFQRLFPGMSLLMPRDVGLTFDFEESGETFLSNAQGKAMALYAAAHRPVLADDSGLCVAALRGAPGIYSARYGSRQGEAPLEAPRRNAYLLEQMRGIENRAAYFVCCLSLVLDADRFVVAQETVHGTIVDAPRGVNGFGYDPLFFLPERGVTMAELPEPAKDSVSHRGRAARRILAFLHSDS